MNFIHPQFAEATEKLARIQDECAKLVREKEIAIENLTRDQVAEVLKQIILAGDLQTLIRSSPPQEIDLRNPSTGIWTTAVSQNVIYMPYQRCLELDDEVNRLKALCEEHGIDHRVTLTED